MAANHLVSIIGVDNAVIKKLESQKIDTLAKFVEKTRSQEGREDLSKRTGIALQSITNWAVQAELFRISGMTAEDADDLIAAGIYTVNQVKNANVVEVMDAVYEVKDGTDRKITLTEANLTKYKKASVKDASSMLEVFGLAQLLSTGVDEGDESDDSGASSKIYSDLSDVICELGKGIAKAQKELDEHSILVQNEIFNNPKLNDFGLNATWYVMPEIDFNLKMDYTVTREKNSKSTSKGRVKILPSSVITQTLYKTEMKEQSDLRIRFVPVPASEKLTARRVVPNCVGLTVEEAQLALEQNNISAYRFVYMYDQSVKDRSDVKVIKKVTYQTLEPGSILPIGKTFEMEVEKITVENE